MRFPAGIGFFLAFFLNASVAADDPRVAQIMESANPRHLQNVADWHCITFPRLIGNAHGRVAQMVREYLRASDLKIEPLLQPPRKCSTYGLSDEHCSQGYLASLPQPPAGPLGSQKKFLGLKNACERLAQRTAPGMSGRNEEVAAAASSTPPVAASASNSAGRADLQRIAGYEEV